MLKETCTIRTFAMFRLGGSCRSLLVMISVQCEV